MTLRSRIDSVKSLQWFEPEDFLKQTVSQADVTAFSCNTELKLFGKVTSRSQKNSPRVTVTTLQRHNTENSKQIFPKKELHGHSPNSYIHVSVGDL
jgi:hypothetical protein